MNAVIYDISRHRRRLLHVREEVSSGYGADWKQVDARVIELGREGAKHNREVCRWLAEAERLGVPGRLGFASLREYAERRVGLIGREGEERVRVGKALADLPGLDEAFSTGKLFWSAVREMTRVVVPETEAAWLAWAVGKSVKQVERQVSGRQLGDRPSDRPDPSLVKHRLSFKVRAETFAMFRELQAGIREELGGGDVDDDLLLHEIMRRAMGGGGVRGEEGGEAGCEDVGRAPYQVAVSRCDACKLVSIDAAGESFPVDAVVENMIGCDAQQLPHVGANKRATQTVPPARRREVMRRERSCCAMPGCRNHRHLHVHHVKPRSEGGNHDPGLSRPALPSSPLSGARWHSRHHRQRR